MLLSVVLLIVGLCAKIQGLEWVTDAYGHVPSSAFDAGHDKYGRVLYVCKGYVHGRPCVGKVSPALGSCKMPWGGKEHTNYNYKVLTEPPWADYTLSWSGTQAWGSVPSGAVNYGSDVYVGRYRHWDSLVPGKVVPRHKALFYAYEGKENYANWNYEVLVQSDRRISHYELTDVTYDFSRAKKILSPNFIPVTVSQQVNNDSPHDVTATVSMTLQKTTTRSWSEMSQLSIEIGVQITATVGVPGLLQASQEFHLTATRTYSYNYGESYSHTVETTNTVAVHLGPNSSASVTTLAQKIRITIPYSGNLTRIFEDGGRYSRDVTGVFRDVHMTSYQSQIDDDVSS